MRMKFWRSLPEMWASTSCPFSSRTLNIAFGRGRTTSPSTSMASFFGKRYAPSSDFVDFKMMGDTRKGRRTGRPGNGKYTSAWALGTTGGSWLGEHLRARLADGDRVFEVGGQAAVGGDHRPSVVEHGDLAIAKGEHRLDGEAHARLDAQAGPRAAVVRHLGVLVHRLPDAMAHERPHDPVAVLEGDGLDGGAHVTQPVARHGGGDAGLHPAPGGVDQVLHPAW